MVPTIYPLETLHNALSLRQVSEFLSNVCQRHTDAQAQVSAALFDSMHSNQASDSAFSPPRTLHSPTSQLRQRSEKPPWYSSGPSSTVSSAGPSSPTALDGNCHFGFSDQSSLRSLVSEEQQSLGLLQEAPGNGAQELPIEGEQGSFEPNLSAQEAPVETRQPCQEVAEEVSQTCQQVPDVSQLCQDIPEEASQPCQEVPDSSQPCQEVPDSSQPCQETHDNVNQTLQEVPQISQLHQKASQLCQKVSEETCQLYQEIPEEFSQPCPDFSVEVGRPAPEPSAINLLSQDIPEVDTPSQEESDVKLQEVPEEVNQQSWVVPEVIDQLPREGVPQAQYPSGDPNPQSQSLAPDHNSPLPPATCD